MSTPYVRQFVCRRCQGCVERETDACAPTYPVRCPREQLVNGCLRPHNKEVRANAA